MKREREDHVASDSFFLSLSLLCGEDGPPSPRSLVPVGEWSACAATAAAPGERAAQWSGSWWPPTRAAAGAVAAAALRGLWPHPLRPSSNDERPETGVTTRLGETGLSSSLAQGLPPPPPPLLLLLLAQ
ncbi:uncharacterized protein PHACADRAFT_192995 [Phanerochaete carnosa HHB-10118-sp]|uniref:Uncharacterized protein n=1 Tax=Phanerochaete carnosa (strain HHB-10118-sp) TaxID=650164 RepID=K5WFM3_PHACS|nr:uncharacterized protein PHACADRAFT_192995 [Phanerochaete carnosa HHB-10118-sp]EKM57859.1 hypothetical protein PHACADRAFT_192995 [Phanerochaete carnosa HHB-10118-sp]